MGEGNGAIALFLWRWHRLSHGQAGRCELGKGIWMNWGGKEGCPFVRRSA